MMPDRRLARDARTPASLRLERLRTHRTWSDRAEPIGVTLTSLRRELEDREKSTGPAQRAWDTVIPQELASLATIVSLRRGTLTVRIQDSSARFAADRLLRAGAEMRILKQCPRTLRRVKLIP